MMQGWFNLALALVVLASIAGFATDRPARRCAIVLAAVQVAAFAAGWNTADWLGLFLLDLAAMVATLWKPAGMLQIAMSGLFLAAAAKNLAFVFSNKSYDSEVVAWYTAMGICIMQASILLLYAGGRLVRYIGFDPALLFRKMVRAAHRADTQ
jgi:hypothetical protein